MIQGFLKKFKCSDSGQTPSWPTCLAGHWAYLPGWAKNKKHPPAPWLPPRIAGGKPNKSGDPVLVRSSRLVGCFAALGTSRTVRDNTKPPSPCVRKLRSVMLEKSTISPSITVAPKGTPMSPKVALAWSSTVTALLNVHVTFNVLALIALKLLVYCILKTPQTRMGQPIRE